MWPKGKYIYLLVALSLIASVASGQPGGGGPPPPPDVPIAGSWLILMIGAGIGALKLKFKKDKD